MTRTLRGIVGQDSEPKTEIERLKARIADLESENARLLKALHREVDHHLDKRATHTAKGRITVSEST